MAEVIVDFAIQKLGEFIIKTLSHYVTGNLASLNELRINVEWMRAELGYMKAFLNDAEGKQEADHRVRHWISDVCRIAEDTTFVLDEFSPKIDTYFQKNGCLETVRYYVFTCRNRSHISDMNEQIVSLKARVEVISNRRETYGISNLSGDRGQSRALVVKELRRTTSYTEMENLFVGFEDVKRQLLVELLKEEPRRSVVSIHGMGGLGKTTLAKSLYNSCELISSFPSRAWICVSQEYDILDLLKAVVKSFRKGCTDSELIMLEKMNVEDLERYLRKLLSNNRYLVVIDDVWEREAWESLQRAFPDCGNGSRVIVTTRSKDVATRMDERVYAHHLRFLNPIESWDLFWGKIVHAQEHDNWCSPAMQNLGREMVAKCGGLPLAVVVVCGLLSHKKNLEEWQDVKEHIWRHLSNDSIDISLLLSLSYDYLPGKLRQCFLYFGTFPEDYLIDAEVIMHVWMGEQFVPSGEEMEDVAESYLNELINRNLIQVATRCWDKIVMCRIHDLLRDLAFQKASKEDFIHIYNPSANPSLVQRKRHAVYTHHQRYFSAEHYNKSLRSLVVLNLGKEICGKHLFDTIFKKFNNLCLLRIEGAWEQYFFPDVLGYLAQLRYLGLFGTCTTAMPPSIGKLKSLQTLEIFLDGQLKCELPQETSKLQSLRHLICNVSGNAEIGCLSSLRTLKSIHYEHWAAIKKENLINLRELVIEGTFKENGKPYILEPFTIFSKLHTLALLIDVLPPLDFLSTCQTVRKLWLCGKIEILPPPENWPTSITLLGLVGSNLQKDSMCTLGRLPNLRRLDLNDSHKSSTMVFAPKSFPQLEILDLANLPNLEKLKLGNGAMPKIKRFHVNSCFKLVDIPDKLNSILLSSYEEHDYADPIDYFKPVYYGKFLDTASFLAKRRSSRDDRFL